MLLNYNKAIYLLLGVLGCTDLVNATRNRDLENNHYFLLELDSTTSVESVTTNFNLIHQNRVGQLSNHYLFSVPRQEVSDPQTVLNAIENSKNNVTSSSHLVARGIRDIDLQFFNDVEKRSFMGFNFAKRRNLERRMLEIRSEFNIHDPGFNKQWYLNNLENPGYDLNLIQAWRMGYTGAGITVALIDDGVDYTVNDLNFNYNSDGSYDFNADVDDPRPKTLQDFHGTRCAGEIAAMRNNDCGVGVAFNSRVSGIRALSAPLLSVDEAEALSYRYDINHIYSCSWGPKDDGRSMGEPQPIAKTALLDAVTNGRQGKGSLYVFASGNGGYSKDNCNFDGYVNSIYTIAVGAINDNHKHNRYSEGCSALLTVTFSGGDGIDGSKAKPIFTTDNAGKCTNQHSGTSAAGPLVSGALALLLEANPNLGWRDVQHLIIKASIPVSLEDPSWSTTFSGRKFSNQYGYGKLDITKLINFGVDHVNVGPQVKLEVGPTIINSNVPETVDGLTSCIDIDDSTIANAEFGSLEHITVNLNIQHQVRRDIEVDLVSPNHIVSHLIETRPHDRTKHGFPNWTTMTVKHFDEPLVGKWCLKVRDVHPNNQIGHASNWTITFFGQKTNSQPAQQQVKLSDTTQQPQPKQASPLQQVYGWIFEAK